MDQILLGRLREASFKGVPCKVKNSKILFGQKTIKHKFPDSNRTEVEFQGLDEDQFQLEIYVHGSGLIEKRNRLKQKLEEPSIGKLVHPYSGEVNCAAMGPIELTENDKEFGISMFSVVFQKSSDPSFPSVSENTKPLILSGIDDVLNTIETKFDSLTAVFSDNSILTATKLTDVFDTFDKASRLTYKIADKANELKEGIDDFQSKIYTYALAPASLGAAIKNLFSIFNFASSDDRDQLKIIKSMFNFGNLDSTILEDTMARIERKKTFKAINDSINVNSMALAYGTASEIDFANDDELAIVRDDLESQFEIIKEDLDLDVLADLEILRNNTLAFLDSLDLADVTTATVQDTSILLLAFNNYGDIERYDDLFYLNKPYDPAFIKDEVKILSE